MAFQEALVGKQVVCLNIPDEYTFGEPALVDELEAKLGERLPDWLK